MNEGSGFCEFPQPTHSAAEHSEAPRHWQKMGRTTHLRTVAAAVVDTTQAPPARTLLHALHLQMPTFVRFTAS